MTDTASATGDADLDTPVRLDDGADLDAFVADHDVALVDFFTKGCTLCQAVEPVVGNVARATDAAVALLNPRNDLDLVDEYDVQSVPTLLLFVDGDLVDRRADGFVETDELVGMVEQYT
jgi:thiol-disulfide isomerase/thioredoxin